MKYYIIRHESDPSIIGIKDGVAQVEIDKSGFQDPQMYVRMMHFFSALSYWEKVDFSPTDNFIIERARPREGAILTDFLSFTPHLMACPFIINQRVKRLFENYKIQEHYYFPVRIYDDNELISDNYYLLYCPFLDYDIIDFPKSSFYTGSDILGKKMVQLNSKEEYAKYLQSNPLLQRERIILTRKFDSALDFFLPRLGGTYVSERLKKAIIAEKLTGIILPEKGPIFESV